MQIFGFFVFYQFRNQSVPIYRDKMPGLPAAGRGSPEWMTFVGIPSRRDSQGAIPTIKLKINHWAFAIQVIIPFAVTIQTAINTLKITQKTLILYKYRL
jgi:hypothetical protein